MARSLSKLSRLSRATRAIAALTCTIGLGSGVALAVESISVDRIHAVWGVDGEVGESSLVIPIRAAHPTCPSWSNRGGLVVEKTETDDHVVLTATFPEHAETEPCDLVGTAMPTTVRLSAPLGERDIIDGSTGLSPATPESLALIIGDEAPDS